ncbi:dTDP-4-dehydrorhamnose 3,5-epimerase [Haloflavibacter putidus]|uniref:dTDP-4-dehydrorhamnose 3,5-epimerase n=1 Tax=Haloflavibacter putidus TaxID=2576776 RepID=A0A507ZUX0_9FLAO|nr:dTDP-4-dehydrorhamnose 3,5-epimerase [Haloflavibacter putidus]TQD40747.1 dTDP-4-dehydrorhamnose 3,5-epimerase [Haloflavibacter putidus]
MQIEKTPLQDCLLITPRVFTDNRGSFFEVYNHQKFKEATGITKDFVQDNQSSSQYGSLRGLHLQVGDYAQAKLVRVVKGKVYDVAVDLRKNSPSFKKVHGAILSEENHKQLFVPRGFAHGFVSLSKEVIFSYKCDNYYNKASERGIIYNDQDLDIDWKIPEKDIILSEKDAELPTLKQFLQ